MDDFKYQCCWNILATGVIYMPKLAMKKKVNPQEKSNEQIYFVWSHKIWHKVILKPYSWFKNLVKRCGW